MKRSGIEKQPTDKKINKTKRSGPDLGRKNSL
jgi:hypothetical protein